MTKKTHTYPLKTTLAAIFIIVAVILGVYGAGIYQIYHFNGKMEIPEGDENVILRIHPDEKGYVYTIVGIPYTIDMGSRHSFITPHTLEILKQHGIDGEEQQTLLYTTDQSGHYNFYTRKVVRPMYFFPNATSTDTVTFNNSSLNMIMTPGPSACCATFRRVTHMSVTSTAMTRPSATSLAIPAASMSR